MTKKKSKKKSSLLWRIIKGFFKYSYIIIKSVFVGIYSLLKWSFSKAGQLKVQKKRKEISADLDYSSFKVVESIKGSLKKFESGLLKKKSLVGIILGARGSGKSAIGMRILENVYAKTKRSCYAIGFKEETLPSWIKCVEDIDSIKNDSIVLIDEGGILFSSRKSMNKANQLLTDLLLIARHKDLTILFITQNSSNLEINAIRQADFLIMKPSSLLQKDFERAKIKDLYEEVSSKFEKYEDEKGITYIYSNDYVGFISNSLPSFWSSDMSKAWSGKKKP